MRRQDRRKKSIKKRFKWILISLAIAFALGLFGFISIIYFGSLVVDDDKLILYETTTIETADGEVIKEIYTENRNYIPIEQIPDHVKNAYIAIEDQRFYEHYGVDVKSIARAVYKDIVAMSKVEGASTITQQLAKNLFLHNEKTWSRKIKEAMAAVYMETQMTKDEILELYLNEIYFGHGLYGIEKASNFYFSKSTSDLTVAEGALLAGLAKAPNGYSPINHPDKALERRNLVLTIMQNTGMISTETKQLEERKNLGLQIKEAESKPWADSYVDLVVKEAQEKQNITSDHLSKGGYRIVVALDEEIQRIAYEKFKDDDYFPGNTAGVEGAFVMMEHESGRIVSAIGGRDYQLSNLNRVTVNRQPGSTFKPLAVFGPALMQPEKYNAYSLLPDGEHTNETYLAANVDGVYAEIVTLYDSIVASKNVPTIWLLDQIGIAESKSYLDKMDMPITDEGLAIALGALSEGVSPLDIMEGYRTFAANGNGIESYAIEEIYDKNDKLIYQAEKNEKEVFNPQVAWDMTEMLSKAVENGSSQAGEYSKALAGKTGTTEHPHVEDQVKDAWFAGYTPEYVTALWMGYDVSDKDHYLTGGSSYPTRLTKDILTEVDKIKPLGESFERPSYVEALPEPIQIEAVTNVKATYELGGFSLVKARITWDALGDDRIVYRIYEERDGIDRRVGEVEGESEYVINHALFKNKGYYVVAYDPLTKLESRKSETVKLEF
ncbi:transglycosylase domain-containing protein [Oceanobacillus sp. CAU 1775]